MPHPTFEHACEENSYWRHYDNYMESKREEEETRERELEESKKQKQTQTKTQSKTQQQQQPLQSDGWTLVTRKRRGQNK